MPDEAGTGSPSSDSPPPRPDQASAPSASRAPDPSAPAPDRTAPKRPAGSEPGSFEPEEARTNAYAEIWGPSPDQPGDPASPPEPGPNDVGTTAPMPVTLSNVSAVPEQPIAPEPPTPAQPAASEPEPKPKKKGRFSRKRKKKSPDDVAPGLVPEAVLRAPIEDVPPEDAPLEQGLAQAAPEKRRRFGRKQKDVPLPVEAEKRRRFRRKPKDAPLPIAPLPGAEFPADAEPQPVPPAFEPESAPQSVPMPPVDTRPERAPVAAAAPVEPEPDYRLPDDFVFGPGGKAAKTKVKRKQ